MSAECPEALSKLELYLDRALGDDEIRQISVHLHECYPCGDRADFEVHLRAVIRTCAEEHAPSGLLEKVRARYTGEA